ncbi:MAG: hypothetical protein IMW89_03420 [Ktedonobacteraceae bacterium]|nr:hypothetical protein [Ktedonobacteraceae bacterium]
MAVRPRPAATVILVRDNLSRNTADQPDLEVFMVRRAVQSEFMPDVYVFPGGSITDDDRQSELCEELCRPLPLLVENDPQGRTALGTGTRAAAIRELFEEANVLLAYHRQRLLALHERNIPRFSAYRQAFHERRGSLVEMARAEQLVLATDLLVYFAHWITPEGMPRRYDTHFFLAAAPEGQRAEFDQLETSDGIWIQPAVALRRFQDHAFPIAFPTYHQLRDLAAYTRSRALIDAAAARPVPTHQPLLKQVDGRTYVYLPDDPHNGWLIQQA